jgi:hypothetical protein
VAALHGHSKVVRILVESVGIKFNGRLSKEGESAVSCACQNGHDEVLEALFELGARVNGTALPAAGRSGSFKCVERLLERKVKIDSSVVELAAACGHADVLGRLLRVCSDFGCAWMIAWLDGFRDGQRLLEVAGARPTWTISGVKLLIGRPGKAGEFAGVVPLPETLVGGAKWKVAELRRVVARLVRDGTATASLLRALIERKWDSRCSPFAACSAVEFANLAIPRDVTTIGESAFQDCASLKEVEIPASVRAIGDCAFEDCSGLTRVVIPSGVLSIGSFAFWGCSGLVQVVISSSVRAIGDSAFYGCSSLTQLEIPSNVGTMGTGVFDSVKLECLTLIGSLLSRAVVSSLKRCLTSEAKVIGASLAGQKFGGWTIAKA